MSLRAEYTRAALVVRYGEGVFLAVLPVADGRDCWSWMRRVGQLSSFWDRETLSTTSSAGTNAAP